MSEIRIKKKRIIPTRDVKGDENGFLLPVLSVNENFVAEAQWPKQVYCTVVAPGKIKGPHLHKTWWGLLTCVKGDVKIVTRIDGKSSKYFSGERFDFETIQVPAGVPSALVNGGAVYAYVLNMRALSWDTVDPDDWDAAFDDYDFGV